MDKDIDLLAKKIAKKLDKQPILDEKINQRLLSARNLALSKINHDMKKSWFDKLLHKIDFNFKKPIKTASILTAAFCLSTIALFFIQDENDFILNDNLSQVSFYFEQADDIFLDTQNYILENNDNDMDNDDNLINT